MFEFSRYVRGLAFVVVCAVGGFGSVASAQVNDGNSPGDGIESLYIPPRDAEYTAPSDADVAAGGDDFKAVIDDVKTSFEALGEDGKANLSSA